MPSSSVSFVVLRTPRPPCVRLRDGPATFVDGPGLVLVHLAVRPYCFPRGRAGRKDFSAAPYKSDGFAYRIAGRSGFVRPPREPPCLHVRSKIPRVAPLWLRQAPRVFGSRPHPAYAEPPGEPWARNTGDGSVQFCAQLRSRGGSAFVCMGSMLRAVVEGPAHTISARRQASVSRRREVSCRGRKPWKRRRRM